MNTNPLAEREKALEALWIKEKECVSALLFLFTMDLLALRSFYSLLSPCHQVPASDAYSHRKQMAKARAEQKQQSTKDTGHSNTGEQQKREQPKQ